MTPVSSVVGPVMLPSSGAPVMAPTGGASLLPSAEPPTLGQLQGAMADLYLILSQLREARVAQSKTQVDGARMGQEIAERERDQALERARRASTQGGLFDWISKDIGLAGVAGLVTFNYALVVADVAAHKLEIVDNVKVDVVDAGAVLTGRYEVVAADILLRKTDLAPKEARAILEKCGIPQDAPGISDDDAKPLAKKALMANLLILSVAATVLSAGSTTGLCIALAGLAISAAGAEVARQKALDGVLGKGSSKWVGVGMQIYGAAATGMSGLAPGAVLLGTAAKSGAAVASGTSTLARSTDKVVIAVHEKERDDANVAAEGAKLRLAQLDRLIEFLIDGIKEASESSRKAGEALQGAIATADETNAVLASATRVRG